MDAARVHLEARRVTSEELWGVLDAPKALASWQLFEKVSRGAGGDRTINELCATLIGLVGGTKLS
jgi:hypothetical protein